MEKEIDLLQYLKVLWKRKVTVLLIVFSGTTAAVGYSLALPNIYRAHAVIMPVGGNKGGNGLSAIITQMGLGGLLGGAAGGSSTSQQLVTILKSRTFMERVIQKHDLAKFLFSKAEKTPPMEDIVHAVQSRVNVVDIPEGAVIKIYVESDDPNFASNLANWYIEDLTEHIMENAFTSAKKNRLFIEGQLERNKSELLESGKELSAFYASNKVSNVHPAIDVSVAIGEPAPPENQHPVSGLRKELEAMEREISREKTVHDVPQQVYLQYLTLRRELLGQVNSLLTQHYEMAKINESKEDLSFEVVDKARVPLHKFKPVRSRITLLSFFVAFLAGCFVALFREYMKNFRKG